MKKIVVGISGSIIISKEEGFEGQKKSYVNEDYINSVILTGAVPIILPIIEDESIIKSYIDTIDALILSGGHDVNPLLYDEEPREKLGEIFPKRDFFDMKLIEYAIEKNIPVLGICRGLQIINVYFGGSLEQDQSYNEKYYLKHNQKVNSTVLSHNIYINKDTRLHKILQKDKILVNSFHHQMIKKLGNDLIIGAYSEDGVIECIEHKTKKIFALQWHPEMLCSKIKDMNKIFTNFIHEI